MKSNQNDDSNESQDPLDKIPHPPSQEALQQAATECFIDGLMRDRQNHDETRDLRRLQAAFDRIRDESRQLVKPVNTRAYTRRFWFLVASSSIAASILFLTFFVISNPADAALVSLDRIIAASMRRLDRSYKIQVVEEYDMRRLPRDMQESDQRVAPELLEGAVLHVRGPNEFVFIHKMIDGETRFSGCDGTESWAFRDSGPVHVSSDLNRFRGGVPGQQQDIPFINLHTDLQQLTKGYDIELLPSLKSSRPAVYLSKLVATRKSSDVRGPKQVNLTFDPQSGVLYEILLDGLPRQRGGPKSVRLDLMSPELLGRNEFAPDFFSHNFHHAPSRKIQIE